MPATLKSEHDLVQEKERLIADIQQLLRCPRHTHRHERTCGRSCEPLACETVRPCGQGQRLAAFGQTAHKKAREAADATDEYVHDNPWQSVGVAAAVSFLLGLLVSRR